VPDPTTPPRWLDHPAFRHPLVRRITGYSAGSVVAVVISETCFAVAYGWGHSGTTLAAAAGFVGGAVPNYILNRRWAWRDRRGRDRRTEILLYMTVAITSFLVSALVTHWAESGARHLTTVRGWQVALITAAYLAVSALFFVVKFIIYETLVFTKASDTDVLSGTGGHDGSETALAPPG
jgi:putative flippase GtrA